MTSGVESDRVSLHEVQTATIIATRLGYNDKCKAEASLFIRHSEDRLLIARFSAGQVFDLLNELDMPCWEKLIGVAIRVDLESGRIGHIVRESVAGVWRSRLGDSGPGGAKRESRGV